MARISPDSLEAVTERRSYTGAIDAREPSGTGVAWTGQGTTNIGDCITRFCGAMRRWCACSWRRVRTRARASVRIAMQPLHGRSRRSGNTTILSSVIEEEERHRREEMSCSNATVSPAQDQISAAIAQGDDATAMRLLDEDRTLIQACDRDGMTPLHVAARRNGWSWSHGCWRGGRMCTRKIRAASRRSIMLHWSRSAQLMRANGFPQVAAAAAGARCGADGSRSSGVGGCRGSGNSSRLNRDCCAQITGAGGLLTLAVNHRQLEMVQLLLDLGADVDERVLLEELEEPTESWGMPLWYAALAGDLRHDQAAA